MKRTPEDKARIKTRKLAQRNRTGNFYTVTAKKDTEPSVAALYLGQALAKTKQLLGLA